MQMYTIVLTMDAALLSLRVSRERLMPSKRFARAQKKTIYKTALR
jgi:hypothetical protein